MVSTLSECQEIQKTGENVRKLSRKKWDFPEMSGKSGLIFLEKIVKICTFSALYMLTTWILRVKDFSKKEKCQEIQVENVRSVRKIMVKI